MSAQHGNWVRWGVFNLVGLLGFGLQILLLFFLRSHLGLDYRLATALAVEAAVLHNFIWHERVTWAGLVGGRAGVFRRLWRFHLANGLISLVGSTSMTWFFVQVWRIPYLLANGISTVLCSVLNFFAADCFVFQ